MTENTARTLDCGKTIDELSDYLAADRIPYDASIGSCPECLNALQGLAGVSQLSRDLIAQDIAELPAPVENWIQGIMTNIHNEVRAGRSLPLHHPDPRVTLSVTEGAVRTLIRSVGDEIPGIIIASCHLDGDAETPQAPVEVTVTASVAWGVSIPDVTHTLRRLVFAALTEHTHLNIATVNVVIEDLHGYDTAVNREQQ